MSWRNTHQLPVRITKKESYYIMPRTPWYFKLSRLFLVGFLVYGTYIVVQIYVHSQDPKWCSPWLQKNVCEADQVQRSIQNQTFQAIKDQGVEK